MFLQQTWDEKTNVLALRIKQKPLKVVQILWLRFVLQIDLNYFLVFLHFSQVKKRKAIVHEEKTRTILVKFEYHSFQLKTQSTFMFQLGSTSSYFPFCFHFHSGQQNFSLLFCAGRKFSFWSTHFITWSINFQTWSYTHSKRQRFSVSTK